VTEQTEMCLSTFQPKNGNRSNFRNAIWFGIQTNVIIQNPSSNLHLYITICTFRSHAKSAERKSNTALQNFFPILE